MRWAALWVFLLGLILVPFLLFEPQFHALALRLANGEASSRAAAAGIAGLLALDVILPVPSSIVSTASGVLFGFWKGAAVCWIGMMLACLIGYAIGWRGSAATARFLGPGSLDRAARLAGRHGSWAIVVCRPVPVLAEASIVFAGLVRAPFGGYLLITAGANFGISLVFAAIGAFSMQVGSFLAAFFGAIAFPGLVYVLFKLFVRTR